MAVYTAPPALAVSAVPAKFFVPPPPRHPPPPAPKTPSSPASQTAFVGGTVSLNVTAFGSPPLAYQWLENTTNLTDTGNVSGSLARTLSLTNLLTNNTGNYSVIVSNSF